MNCPLLSCIIAHYVLTQWLFKSRSSNWFSKSISLQIGRGEVLPARHSSLHWLDVCVAWLCRWLVGVLRGFKFYAFSLYWCMYFVCLVCHCHYNNCLQSGLLLERRGVNEWTVLSSQQLDCQSSNQSDQPKGGDVIHLFPASNSQKSVSQWV